ncbi:MAG: hypothetical protein EBS38_07970 [Actinobacteria bacterium]|nr:hypothetical protein [Actinomycetota bacterium]
MTSDLRALPSGTRLSDYKLERVLGHGGFGITYLAVDLSLDQKVAIKEYYPREFAVRDSTKTIHAAGNAEDKDNFSWGLERFREEAKTLARFSHPNVVAIRRLFEANGTSYIVMEFCEGEPLDKLIKREAPLSKGKLEAIFASLMDGLEHVHAAGVMHRDIKPANIFIRADGSPVLLDFGAARQALVSHSRSMTSLATAHYAAFEQYSTHGKQGAWTDIYGLAATLYHAATGEKPQDAPDRILEDTLEPIAERAAGQYSEHVLKAIDAGLAVRPEDRPQSIKKWQETIKQGDAKRSALGSDRFNSGKINWFRTSLKTQKLAGFCLGLVLLLSVVFSLLPKQDQDTGANSFEASMPGAVAQDKSSSSASERSPDPNFELDENAPETHNRPAQNATLLSGSISLDDYPRDALNDEEQGTSTATYVVNPDGKISSCSAFGATDRLNWQTCNLISSRFRYEPARDEQGNPVAERLVYVMAWRLMGPIRARQIAGTITSNDYPVEALNQRETGTSTAYFNITVDGRVRDCVASGATPLLDSTACNLITARFRFRPARDSAGKPITETKIQRITWSL